MFKTMEVVGRPNGALLMLIRIHALSPELSSGVGVGVGRLLVSPQKEMGC